MNEQATASLVVNDLDHEVLFPIREVARLTGVNPVTLRAWERRYGLIQPKRTESGHRLYSQTDIDDVHSILGWLDRGVAVSKVGRILARSRTLDVHGPAAAAPEQHARYQAQVREAVRAFDGMRLEQLYGLVFASTALAQVFEAVFMPVWVALRRERAGFGQASEWLFLDHFLRARVLQRLYLTRDTQARHVVLAPLDEHVPELELLVAGLLLDSDDITMTVLAPGQPLDELPLVCERLSPAALVLFANRPPTAGLGRRLSRLALALECPLLLAGETAEMAHENLAGTQVACLGAGAGQIRRRLQQSLAGHLDT